MDKNNPVVLIFVGIVAVAIIAVGTYVFISQNNSTNPPQGTDQATDDKMEEDKPNKPIMEDEGDSIYRILNDSNELTTLFSAVTLSGLEETLDNEEAKYTLLAPNDDAFDKIKDTVTTLLQDPTGNLRTILTYHVIEGDVMSSALTDGMVVTTVLGKNLTVKLEAGSVIFVDENGGMAKVVKADIETNNGYVHEIDTVLTPIL